MKTIEITSHVNLDEISDHLRKNLSPEELAKWAVSIGDKHEDCIDYWICLYRESKKVWRSIISG